MAMRLHEVHPSLVHYPLVLLPLSIAMDAIGKATGSPILMGAARRLMPVTAASGLITGLAGLVAQETVRAEGRAHEMLITHRNMNISLVLATTVMTVMRMRRKTPSLGYLLTGLAGVLAMNYSAYIGGKMVYAHGLGVEPAGGVRREESPELVRDNIRDAARQSATHAGHAIKHAARQVAHGEIMPALRVH